jgi:hypothetical protein
LPSLRRRSAPTMSSRHRSRLSRKSSPAAGNFLLVTPRGHSMRPISPSSDIKVLFIAGFGPTVRDRDESAELYREVFGIAFKEESGGYLHTEGLKGAKTFALWPLSQAAQSCFGAPDCAGRDRRSQARQTGFGGVVHCWNGAELRRKPPSGENCGPDLS